jgi:hypothetical protein
MEGRNRMYLDLAAQGFTPYHYGATASSTQDAPLAAMSVPERQAKLGLLVRHLANPCDGAYRPCSLGRCCCNCCCCCCC